MEMDRVGDRVRGDRAERSRICDVKSKLSALDRVKGSDSTANQYVSDYPCLCDDFERAAQQLWPHTIPNPADAVGLGMKLPKR
jgi:hypothetical protein